MAGNQSGTIKFKYTATGQKVQKTVQTNAGTTTTLYDHGLLYEDLPAGQEGGSAAIFSNLGFGP